MVESENDVDMSDGGDKEESRLDDWGSSSCRNQDHCYNPLPGNRSRRPLRIQPHLLLLHARIPRSHQANNKRKNKAPNWQRERFGHLNCNTMVLSAPRQLNKKSDYGWAKFMPLFSPSTTEVWIAFDKLRLHILTYSSHNVIWNYLWLS